MGGGGGGERHISYMRHMELCYHKGCFFSFLSNCGKKSGIFYPHLTPLLSGIFLMRAPSIFMQRNRRLLL